jgi:hypothetical protein
MDVAITPSGFVVRTEDGKVLLRDIDMQREARKDFDTPTADGDVVYFTRSLARDAPGPEVSEAAAFRLVMLDRDRVGAKPLWRTLIATDFCGGVVVEQGRLYGLAGDLWVLDAQTGAVLPRVGKVFAYPPADSWIPTCAGKGVVVAADSWRGLESWPRGVTVIRTQPWPRVVARNLNDYMVAHPAMDGDRLYLRTSQAVACVARTGEAGARYEAEVNARTILGQMQRRRPDDSPPVEPAPRPVAGNAAMIVDGEVIAPWHVAGPVPLRLKEAARTAMGIPGWTLKGTGLVAVAGANVPHGPYPRPDAAARANRYDDGIDALRDIHVAGDTVSYWYAPCYVRRERVLRFEASQVPGVSAWLSDVPVRDGQRVRLKPGNYALVLEVEVAGAPPSRLEVAPRFWASDDPDRELREWLDRVRADRDILEAATRLLSETDVGRVCAGMLKASRH